MPSVLLIFGSGLLAGTMNALVGGGILRHAAGADLGRAAVVVRTTTLLVAGCITALFFARTYGFGR